MASLLLRFSNVNLLSNILPGVRDFRAPAIAGILWLAVLAWLLAQPSGESTHEWLLSTSEDLTTIEVSVALVASYLIGSIGIDLALTAVEGLQRFALRRLAVRDKWSSPTDVQPIDFDSDFAYRSFGSRFWQVASYSAQDRLRQWSTATVHDYETTTGIPLPEESKRELFVQAVQLDLTARLVSAPELERVYQQFSKQKAEAELRLGVCVPLAVLTVLLATDDVPKPAVVVFLGSLLSAGLFVQGVLRLRASKSIVAIAVSDGLIDTPLSDRLKSQATHTGPEPSGGT